MSLAASTKDKPRAWSYSALKSFESCPKRYFNVNVQKKYKDQGEAMQHGMLVHSAFDLRMNRGQPFPLGMRHYEKYAKLVEKLPGTEILSEIKLAITADFEPCGFFANDVWCRCVIDVIKLDVPRAFVIDWKTGKRKTDDDQLAIMAGTVFAHMPEIEEIRSLFIWLQDGDHDKAVYNRDDIPGIWNRFSPRVTKLQHAFQTQDFPARASGLCKYCPVISCQHHD